MKDLISPLRDRNDNNMLHLVGKCAKQKRLEDVSGVALKLQRELPWFKVYISLDHVAMLIMIIKSIKICIFLLQKVEAMIPSAYRERKNKDGLTPYELFTKEHKDLVDQGEKWLRDMANHCMEDIAKQKTNTMASPSFYQNHLFLVFVSADSGSFLLSCASICIFSSIQNFGYPVFRIFRIRISDISDRIFGYG
ncbi:hypothetical protein Hanom_Chr07g00672471 [Helianthus anomalus]